MSRTNRTENSTSMAYRVAAFGAIRRAAAVAQEHDRIAWKARVEWNELVCERHDENAEAIRDAIRAAIESPKQ